MQDAMRTRGHRGGHYRQAPGPGQSPGTEYRHLKTDPETTPSSRRKPARTSDEGAPAFSFVVPCYNEEKNLAATVAEIAKAAEQAGLESFEIVAVDDASTDGTGAVISGLVEDDPRIQAAR